MCSTINGCNGQGLPNFEPQGALAVRNFAASRSCLASVTTAIDVALPSEDLRLDAPWPTPFRDVVSLRYYVDQRGWCAWVFTTPRAGASRASWIRQEPAGTRPRGTVFARTACGWSRESSSRGSCPGARWAPETSSCCDPDGADSLRKSQEPRLCRRKELQDPLQLPASTEHPRGRMRCRDLHQTAGRRDSGRGVCRCVLQGYGVASTLLCPWDGWRPAVKTARLSGPRRTHEPSCSHPPPSRAVRLRVRPARGAVELADRVARVPEGVGQAASLDASDRTAGRVRLGDA